MKRLKVALVIGVGLVLVSVMFRYFGGRASETLAPSGDGVKGGLGFDSVAEISPVDQSLSEKDTRGKTSGDEVESSWQGGDALPERILAFHRSVEGHPSGSYSACEAYLRELRFVAGAKVGLDEAMVANEVMAALVSWPGKEHNAVPLLRQLIEDPQQSPVIRDYALQHYVTHQQNRVREHPKSRATRQGERELLWNLLGHSENGLRGTVLVGLGSLSRDFDARERSQFFTALESAIFESEASGELRASAFNLAREHGLESVLPVAWDVALDGEESLLVRVAAARFAAELEDHPHADAAAVRMEELPYGVSLALEKGRVARRQSVEVN